MRFEGYVIRNIRVGTASTEKPYGGRPDTIYAELRYADNNLQISATLDHIVEHLKRTMIAKDQK